MKPVDRPKPPELFSSDAEIRRIASEATLMISHGGPRALVLQVAHPKVGRGVAEHSDFSADPLGRLQRTMEYIFLVVFGTAEEAEHIGKVVYDRHTQVVGPGYSANDPKLQVWVNATLFDTAMLLYEKVFGPLDAASKERCYQQWSALATTIGCPRSAWPATLDEFSAYWDRMVDSIEINDTSRREIDKILYMAEAPLRKKLLLLPGLPVARFIAVGLTPDPVRRQLDYRWTERHERWLQRLFRVHATVVPHLPQAVRRAPVTYYLWTARRRLAALDNADEGRGHRWALSRNARIAGTRSARPGRWATKRAGRAVPQAS